MLIVKYRLSSGESGEDVVVGDDKWTFGRGGGDDVPSVTVDDRRVSRTALVIRDSGPGPVGEERRLLGEYIACEIGR